MYYSAAALPPINHIQGFDASRYIHTHTAASRHCDAPHALTVLDVVYLPVLAPILLTLLLPVLLLLLVLGSAMVAKAPHPYQVAGKDARLERNADDVHDAGQLVEGVLGDDAHEREEGAHPVYGQKDKVDADDAAVALGDLKVRGHEAGGEQDGSRDAHDQHRIDLAVAVAVDGSHRHD